MTETAIILPRQILAAFTLNLGRGSLRVITVEPTLSGSLRPFAVLCDGEPIPVNAREDALFQRAADAMAFALEYCGWHEVLDSRV